jgi:hypothetical protein
MSFFAFMTIFESYQKDSAKIFQLEFSTIEN